MTGSPLRTLASLGGIVAMLAVAALACGGGTAPSFDRQSVEASRNRALAPIAPDGAPARRADVEAANAPGTVAPQVDASATAQRYAADAFVVGTGYDDTSFDAARAAAFAQIARQLGSRLDATLVVVSTRNNDETTVDVDERIRETARFDRTELLEVVPDASGCSRRGCQVLAVLDRQQAGAALRRELEPELDAWEARVRALDPGATPWDTAESLGRALHDQQRLRAAIAQLQVVSGAADDLIDRWQVASTLAEQRVEQVLASAPVTIVVQAEHDAVQSAGVEAGLRAALVALGAHVDESAECTGARLRASVDARCATSFVGHRCETIGELSLEACDGAPLATGRLDGVAAGAHPSLESRALEALRDGLMATDYRDTVAATICAAWPCLRPSL